MARHRQGLGGVRSTRVIGALAVINAYAQYAHSHGLTLATGPQSGGGSSVRTWANQDSVPAGAPAVSTSSGRVWGTSLPASAGGEVVNQFLGIPFATAERWAPPKDFSGPYASNPRNSTMWGPACLQVLTQNTTYGSEECLVANVWQPASATRGSLKKVLVFIYGGSDEFGEAEPYNMSGISAFHDTVTVNFNYRTGPIGWMAFPEDAAAGRSTGNWGILDIQAALRWVRREIGAFGGDPTKVAIHGQSSGGGLVELQYVAPDSDNLFRAAISESGGLGATNLSDAIANTRAVAKAVGCGRAANLKACMTALKPLQITSLTYAGSWGPTTDGVTFPEDPTALLSAGRVNNCSIVLGAQTNDSQLFLFRDYTADDDEPQPNDDPTGDLKNLSDVAYAIAVEQETGARFLTEALELYPPTVHKSIANVHQLGRVESDSMLCSARQRARLFDRAHPGRAFTYRFNYWYQSNQRCTAVPNFHLPYMGAVHQDEVTFVMGQPNFMEDGSCCGKWGLSEGAEGCPRQPRCTDCYDPALGEGYRAYFNEKEWAFARTIGTFWTNMALGSPNSVASPAVPRWPPVSDGGVVLDADEPGGVRVEAAVNGDPRICAFWDKVGEANGAV